MSYFDETIFTCGESFSEFTKINVYNEADAFLVAKHGMESGTECTSRDDEFVANLNPRGICSGINIYSMDPRNKLVKKIANFNQISIYNGETNTPIAIGEHQPGQVYDVGLLTPFESAIMLKYFAINNTDVYITSHLHAVVEKYLYSGRAWFNHVSRGVVRNHKNELILNNEIINVPTLTFASDDVDI